jgi:hypothetical protein
MFEVDVHAAAATFRAAVHHGAGRREARGEDLLVGLETREVGEVMVVERVGDAGVLGGFGHGGEN